MTVFDDSSPKAGSGRKVNSSNQLDSKGSSNEKINLPNGSPTKAVYKGNINVPDYLRRCLIPEKLPVIMVLSNPCNFERRWQLAREFISRMETDPNIILYRVEVIYPCQGRDTFEVTSSDDPRHLQIRTEHPIWHKEPMINAGIQKLLPSNWTKVAWVDADLDFENVHWASDTLKLLDIFDIVQCFTHCLDLGKDGVPMHIWQGGAFGYINGFPNGKGSHFWHSGYAWAMTRETYEKTGGLYELGILGSGDHNMFQAWMGNSNSVNGLVTSEYKKSVENYTKRCSGVKVGYVPGVIKHFFHGSKANRKYMERWQIIVKNGYNPELHVWKNLETGLLEATPECPKELLEDIMKYFLERNEDE